MISWIWHNKEWIFSGFGLTIISSLIALFFKRQQKSPHHQSINQKQRGGKKSINVQIGKIEGREP